VCLEIGLLLLVMLMIQLLVLVQVAQVRSLFNDPVEQIQELTYLVKRDINDLNKQLEVLQTLQDNKTPQSAAHSGTVVATLSTRLQGTTSNFRQVLEVRTEVWIARYGIDRHWRILLMVVAVNGSDE
jgi:hypothetical protein